MWWRITWSTSARQKTWYKWPWKIFYTWCSCCCSLRRRCIVCEWKRQVCCSVKWKAVCLFLWTGAGVPNDSWMKKWEEPFFKYKTCVHNISSSWSQLWLQQQRFQLQSRRKANKCFVTSWLKIVLVCSVWWILLSNVCALTNKEQCFWNYNLLFSMFAGSLLWESAIILTYSDPLI